MAEKGLEFKLVAETPWERRDDFLRMNPSGEVPVLVEEDGTVLSDHIAICEYLEDIVPEANLLTEDPITRAEVRRLVAWFDRKFNREVGRNLVGEKLIRRLRRQGAPDSRAVRAGKANISMHMQYLDWLIERRRWIAGESMTLADLTAAAHLSVVDYVGDVPWDHHPETKNWYARIKSRPSFRSLLSDTLPGILPPAHYSDLDF